MSPLFEGEKLFNQPSTRKKQRNKEKNLTSFSGLIWLYLLMSGLYRCGWWQKRILLHFTVKNIRTTIAPSMPTTNIRYPLSIRIDVKKKKRMNHLLKRTYHCHDGSVFTIFVQLTFFNIKNCQHGCIPFLVHCQPKSSFREKVFKQEHLPVWCLFF